MTPIPRHMYTDCFGAHLRWRGLTKLIEAVGPVHPVHPGAVQGPPLPSSAALVMTLYHCYYYYHPPHHHEVLIPATTCLLLYSTFGGFFQLSQLFTIAIDWRATPSHAIVRPAGSKGGGGRSQGPKVTVTLTVESHYLGPRSFHQTPLTNEISSRPTMSGHVPDRVRSTMGGGGKFRKEGKRVWQNVACMGEWHLACF